MTSSHVTPRARLLVTRALPQSAMDLVHGRFDAWANPDDRTMTRGEIVSAALRHQPGVVLVMAMDSIDKALLAALPPCVRTIATYSVGHDHIDLAAARARGIAVLSTPDVLSDAVAEMAILLMLCAARRAREGALMLYEGRWQGWSPTQLLGRDLTRARLGVFGMGRIGRTIARKAHRGFEMPVHYHNRSRLDAADEDGATYHADIVSLLSVSDVLVLAAPSTAETKGFLNTSAIRHLPAGAIVVNIARGDLVDDAALIDALRSGRIAAAGLDVFNGEPALNPGYLTLPSVFLQPHQGSSTIGTRVRMAQLLLDSVVACQAGTQVANRLV